MYDSTLLWQLRIVFRTVTLNWSFLSTLSLVIHVAFVIAFVVLTSRCWPTALIVCVTPHVSLRLVMAQAPRWPDRGRQHDRVFAVLDHGRRLMHNVDVLDDGSWLNPSGTPHTQVVQGQVKHTIES